MSGTIQKTKATNVFSPLPWQVAAWRDKAFILLLTGSAGGGKSRLAAEKIHALNLKYPGATSVVGRKDKTAANKSVVPFLLNTVMGDTDWGVYKSSHGIFEYSNGSQMWVVGLQDEKQRESLRSIGKDGSVDFAWFEEANKLTEEDHNEVLGRMRGDTAGWRQLMYTMNPDAPMHWAKTRLIESKEASVHYSGAKDNPYNPPEYMGILDQMTGLQRLRLVEGKWVQAEGVVYDSFDMRVHVLRRELSEMHRFGLALDEGYTNPAAMLLIGEDGDKRVHVFREFYKSGVLQKRVVEEAQKLRRLLIKFDTISGIGDAFMGAIVDEAAAGLVADLRDVGVSARGYKGRVLDGITTVQGLLRIQGDGRPRLTVDPRCKHLIAEFTSYSWKTGKDEPIKEFDHALDALRYYCAYHYPAGKPAPQDLIGFV